MQLPEIVKELMEHKWLTASAVVALLIVSICTFNYLTVIRCPVCGEVSINSYVNPDSGATIYQCIYKHRWSRQR